jgi:hypothetical protein
METTDEGCASYKSIQNVSDAALLREYRVLDPLKTTLIMFDKDDYESVIDIGDYVVTLFGTKLSQLSVSSNGLVTAATHEGGEGASLASSKALNLLDVSFTGFYPYWQDLVQSNTSGDTVEPFGNVMYSIQDNSNTQHEELIIQYTAQDYYFPCGSKLQFQIVYDFDDGMVQYIYQNVTYPNLTDPWSPPTCTSTHGFQSSTDPAQYAYGANAAVGIYTTNTRVSSANYTQYSFHSPNIYGGDSVCFLPSNLLIN